MQSHWLRDTQSKRRCTERGGLMKPLHFAVAVGALCFVSLPFAIETEAAENATSFYLLGLRGPLAASFIFNYGVAHSSAN